MGFQMDNGVAKLEAAFADLHLEFRHYPRIENSDAGSKPEKISVGFDCGSLSSAMFSPKMVASFRQMQSSVVNKPAR